MARSQVLRVTLSGAKDAFTMLTEDLEQSTTDKKIFDPASGFELSSGLSLFHDGAPVNLCLSERLNGGVWLEFGAFDGSYLSIALPLPDQASFFRHKRAVFEMTAVTSRPVTTFLRLNIGTTEKKILLHDCIVLSQGNRRCCFNVEAYDFAAEQIESVWLDLILSRPHDVNMLLDGMTLRSFDPGKPELTGQVAEKASS